MTGEPATETDGTRAGAGGFAKLRWGRWRTVLALAVGVGAGVAGTTLARRPSPVAFLEAGAAEARVVDARGRSVAVATGGGRTALAAGARVQAGPTTRVTIITVNQVKIALSPHAEVTVFEGRTVARIEQGGVVIDARAAVDRVAIATATGEVELASSLMEVRAAAASNSGGGAGGLLALVRVEEGSVLVRSAGRDVPLEAGGQALLAGGRPPMMVGPVEEGARDDDRARGDRDAEAAAGADEATRRWNGALSAAAPSAPHIALLALIAPPRAATVPAAAPAAGLAVTGGAPGAGTGDVQGTVEVTGTPPPSDAPGAASVGCVGRGDAAWAVERGRLANVYVHVSSTLPRFAGRAPVAAVPVTHQACGFSPRVSALLVDQPLELRAVEGSPHEVRVMSGASTLLSAALPAASPPAVWRPARAGLLRLHCDQHQTVVGHVAVSAHPFFAVSGVDGSFRITGLPAGRHTLTAWHELGGEKVLEVTVAPGRSAPARFSYVIERPPLVATAPPPAVEPVPAAAPAAPPGSPVPPSPAPPPEPDDEAARRCRIAVGPSPVAQACAQGGIPAAQTFMKQVVRQARGRGLRLRCETCHPDARSSYALTPLARERLAQLLAPPIYALPLSPLDPRVAARLAAERRARGR